ncbi:YfcL family protein [Shewanella sp. JM162201]|uniref:YfcL family protein n=1 Tax=Shewanella jiangmenensis TaxID=2837387 RepID=A0ABS5V7B8_9GAMM|nr:YfcL family protein [Shewanella jiangmenensis]MBT1446335.1 YfcL family protein [Shewanella jiangmenensis]
MFEKYDAALDQWIEGIVASGDDDALFASGYLQGHLAVALAELEAEGAVDNDSLDAKMENCLATARGELSDDDFALVTAAWAELRSAF